MTENPLYNWAARSLGILAAQHSSEENHLDGSGRPDYIIIPFYSPLMGFIGLSSSVAQNVFLALELVANAQQ